MLQRLHGGVTRARIMPLNPDPSDLGACYVWDDGAEQPRPRRDDEVTLDGGLDPSEYNLFVLLPNVGVSRSHFVA